jgi:DinB superfamily
MQSQPTAIDLSRIPAFYHRYIQQLGNVSLAEGFQRHQNELVSLLKDVPEEKWEFRYEPSKWTIKQLVQHVIDAERIFNYRALCISRGDQTPLPGFDENLYAERSGADLRKPNALMAELIAVQQSSALLFTSFSVTQLNQVGTANGNPVSVEGIGYILLGHAVHHKNILSSRYLA